MDEQRNDYNEMIWALADNKGADLLEQAIAIPPSDPVHDLAWVRVSMALNARSKAILNYLNKREQRRMAEPDTYAPEDRPESWGSDE